MYHIALVECGGVCSIRFLLVRKLNYLIAPSLGPSLLQTGMNLSPKVTFMSERVKVFNKDGHPHEQREYLAIAPLILIVLGGDSLLLGSKKPKKAYVYVRVKHGVGCKEQSNHSAPGYVVPSGAGEMCDLVH